MELNGQTLTTTALETIRTERTVTNSPMTRYVGPTPMVMGTRISKVMMPSLTTQHSGMIRMETVMETIKVTNADLFPNDSSEWYDADGDGVGDNSDDFIYDGSQTVDSDGDGYGDNANGSQLICSRTIRMSGMIEMAMELEITAMISRPMERNGLMPMAIGLEITLRS